VVLTRRAAGEGQVFWDGERLGPWAREVDGSDVVINLAGRSVSCRYTKGNLTEMMRSRVRSARVVGQAIASAGRPPRAWLQMSTATIYAHARGAPNDEVTGVIGGSERQLRQMVSMMVTGGTGLASRAPATTEPDSAGTGLPSR
jgi:uncharacterized protein